MWLVSAKNTKGKSQKAWQEKKVKRINEQTLAKLTKLIQFNFGVKTSAGNVIGQYLQQQNSNILNAINSLWEYFVSS